MTKQVAQPQEKFVVRFPDGMRDRIATAAEKAGRSMNAEIVQRLSDSLEPRDDRRLAELADCAEEIAYAAGVLKGHLSGAAAVLEAQGELPSGSLTASFEDEANELVRHLDRLDDLVRELRRGGEASIRSGPATRSSRS